jgi:hypothetical protein
MTADQLARSARKHLDEDDEDDPAMSLDALLRIRVRQIMREELVAA